MKKAQLEKYFLLGVVIVLMVFAGYIVFKNISRPACGDGRCQGLENCNSCTADCPCKGVCKEEKCIAETSSCGNAVCDKGEDCRTCEIDCPCTGTYGNESKLEISVKCGNGICEGLENCANCLSDCPCSEGRMCDSTLGKCVRSSSCGDGVCSQDDNCADCPSDCPCDMGAYCDKNLKTCVKPNCGNNRCEFFENQDNCCIDCPCSAKFMVCRDMRCIYPSIALTNREAEQIAIAYLRDQGLTVQRTIDIADFAWDDVLVKKISFETVEQRAPCVVVVKENREVEVLVTY